MKDYQAIWTLSESHDVLLSYIRFLTLGENLKIKTQKKLKHGITPTAALDIG